MVVRPFWLYVPIEMAVIVALAWGLGVGWTLLILVTTCLLGLALAGAQIRRQVRRLRAGMTVYGASGFFRGTSGLRGRSDSGAYDNYPVYAGYPPQARISRQS
jgi:hypothetical protein